MILPAPEKIESFSEDFRFRNYEFEELLASFHRVFTNPGEVIARVIIIGPPGSGKSYILRYFQLGIENRKIKNEENNIQLRCEFIDCKKYSSTKSAIFEIILKIDPYFYANIEECQTAELLYILADTLLAKKEAIIILFDNIDSLVEKEPEEVNELLYSLQRFSEGKTKEEPNLFSQVLVAHNLDFLADLDRTVFRKISTDVIPFEAYSAEQIFQLLQDFVIKNIRKKISEETLWFLSLISQGNMNRALEVLNKAVDKVKAENLITISPEHIRFINKNLTDYQLTQKMIDELSLGSKLMLLAIARKFKKNSKAFIPFLDLPGFFFEISEEYDKLHLAKNFSEIFDTLQKLAIISVYNFDKEIFIYLADISAQELTDFLEKNIKIKKLEKPYFL